MIKFISVACLIASVYAANLRNDDQLLIDGTRYLREEFVKLDFLTPRHIVVDDKKNSIYFISVKQGTTQHDVKIIRERSDIPDTIPGITQGQTIAVDEKSGLVYIGSANGLLCYDDNNRNFTKVPIPTSDIVSIAIASANKLLYLDETSGKVFEANIETGTVTESPTLNLANDLTFDKNGNLYYTTEQIPHLIRNGEDKPETIKGDKEDFKVVDFTTNKEGNVLAISLEGNLYRIDANEAEVVYIGNAGIINTMTTSIAVESDGSILIGYNYGIMRLRKSN